MVRPIEPSVPSLIHRKGRLCLDNNKLIDNGGESALQERFFRILLDRITVRQAGYTDK